MLENREGQQVPEVTFRIRKDGQWLDVTTQDLFGGKTVVVFSLPGAFTPTCSSRHVPRFNELASTFEQNGVDDIICMSVNDTFVMNAWKEDQDAEHITFIPDGNGDFSEGMGMLVDKANLGFGKRSWRYSMLVRDGIVEKMFIEPDVEGDPFEVSDADTMLNHINPQARKPVPVTMFSLPGCPHCARARALLQEHGMPFEDVELAGGVTRSTLRAVAGADTTPQIFVDGKYLGDDDALEAYLKSQS